MSISLIERTQLRQIVDRQFALSLDMYELNVVRFIFEVTIAWGKVVDRIKVEHSCNGLGPVPGTGFSDKKVRLVLKTLQFRGVITRRRTPYGYLYAINFEWKSRSITVLKVPKKQQNGSAAGLATPKKSGEIGTAYRSRSVRETDLYTREDTSTEDTSTRSPIGSEGGAPVRAIAASTAARLKAVADAKLAKDKGKRKADLSAVWLKAYRETFPDATVPFWTAKELGQARLFLRGMPADPMPEGERLSWFVVNWALVINARFAWMTESPPPEFPTIGFMLAFKDRFYEAFNEKARLRKDLTVSTADRRVRVLIRQGLSEEEARTQVEAQQGLGKERAKLEEERKALNDMMRRVEARRAVTPPVVSAPTRVRSRPAPIRPTGDHGGGFGTLPGFDDEVG